MKSQIAPCSLAPGNTKSTLPFESTSAIYTLQNALSISIRLFHTLQLLNSAICTNDEHPYQCQTSCQNTCISMSQYLPYLVFPTHSRDCSWLSIGNALPKNSTAHWTTHIQSTYFEYPFHIQWTILQPTRPGDRL